MAAVYNITTIKGDTWNGLSLTIQDTLSAPLDLTNAVITMQVKKVASDSVSVLEFSTADNTIVISNALNGAIQIPSLIIDIPARVYVYDLEVVTQDAITRTVIGGTFTVTQDVTR